MTPVELAATAGVVLSLALAYFPGLKAWYDGKDTQAKAQIMGGLLVAVALAVFGLSCANLYLLVECSVNGAKELLSVLIAALVANQGAYMLMVRPFKASRTS